MYLFYIVYKINTWPSLYNNILIFFMILFNLSAQKSKAYACLKCYTFFDHNNQNALCN